ncbi:MAG: DUF192 domain-containing protein [Pseudomonadota bacterium]
MIRAIGYASAALKRWGTPILCCVAAVWLGLSGCSPDATSSAPSSASDAVLEVSDARLVTDQGAFDFVVEVARTPEEQRRGLMFRRSLAEDAGMLFVHESDRVLGMWMKNTYLPLDMAFLDREGRIVAIAADRTPHSLDHISSGVPARAVLEVNAGRLKALGAKVGDRLLHEAFGAPVSADAPSSAPQ